MANLEPEDLEAWKLAMSMVSRLYKVTRKWPDDERYGLTSQVRRAAVSVPANIAEGHGRSSTKEFIRFLEISLGSLAELRTLMRVAHEIGLTTRQTLESFLSDAQRCGQLIGGLKRALRKRLA